MADDLVYDCQNQCDGFVAEVTRAVADEGVPRAIVFERSTADTYCTTIVAPGFAGSTQADGSTPSVGAPKSRALGGMN